MPMMSLIVATGFVAMAPAIVPAAANPASVYCVQQGGRIEILRTPEGETGICVLPDGRRIDEWTFFRAGRGGKQD